MTTPTFLSLIKKNKSLEETQRRGMFTTGVLSKYQGHTICLYLSGRNHSGENMGKVLSMRSGDLPPIIRMADALSSNFTGHFIEYACKYLTHGRPNFV